jgi:hypothetical protein
MTAPSPRVELDEVALYDQPLTDNEVLLLNAYTTTELGPSGRRWGAWATQGGSAFVDSSVPEKVTAILNDTAYSSSGVFALLGPEKNPYELLDLSNADLSAFDEAVLRASWVGLPANSRSFQFALSSEHGKRQCTWQLTASEQPYYVINLRQPSWCVDPTCQFDTTNVERASIAADWTSAEGKVQFDVQALSFRKRIMSPADGSNGIATRLGGRSGDPGNFCWRPVSFYSDSLARLYPPLEGTGLDVRSSGGNGNAPALTADLFGGADAKRDFTQCPYVLAQTAAALPSNEDFRVVLTNEDGQTWSCSLAHSGTGNSYGVALESSTACFAWPPNVEGATLAHPTSASEVLGSTVRIALKSTVNFQLTALQCCDSSGQNCHDIDDAWPPSVNP